MDKILILFAHPRYEKSRINRVLLRGIESMPRVTLHDLYEEYPDFNIDTDREKALLKNHRIVVWHHPFFMYGVPALLKQWIDLVLEYGWAHGKNGDNLRGKIIFNALTAGGTRDVYSPGGFNSHTIKEFLVPFEQTARLCRMTYLPPFVVHGTHLLTDEEVEAHRRLYHELLDRLGRGDYDPETMPRLDYLNDWPKRNKGAVAS